MKSKKSYNQALKNSSVGTLTNVPLSESSTSDIEKLKNLYLPHSKDDYHPSEESIENANNLQPPEPPSPDSLT